MGRGIAQIAAQAGSTVRLYDTQPEAVAKARDELFSQWDRLLEKGPHGRAPRCRPASSACSPPTRCRRWPIAPSWSRPSSSGWTSRSRCSPSSKPWSRPGCRARDQYLVAVGHGDCRRPEAAAALRRLPLLQPGAADEGGGGGRRPEDRSGGVRGAGRLRARRWATRRCRRRTRPASSSTTPAAATAPRRCASWAKAWPTSRRSTAS